MRDPPESVTMLLLVRDYTSIKGVKATLSELRFHILFIVRDLERLLS